MYIMYMCTLMCMKCDKQICIRTLASQSRFSRFLYRVGESRAYWSLGNNYTALGDHRQARHFANKHLQLSVQLGDQEGIEISKRNLADLDNVLELSEK